ncbi:MAG: hypothetical protein JNL01_00505 [Bdellovibrionales bacterium]|nr:hypothetical protein [Bdellovibrionales bacterium]
MKKGSSRKKKKKLWKKRAILVFLSLVATELVLRAAGSLYNYVQHQGAPKADFSETEVRVLCLGESTTAWGLSDSYPSQLQDLLQKKDPSKKYLVYNEGLTGATTGQILEKLPGWIAKYRPHYVVTMMGINDPVFLSGRKESILLRVRLFKFIHIAWVNLTRKVKSQGQAKVLAKAWKNEKLISEASKIYYDKQLYSRFGADQSAHAGRATHLFKQASWLEPKDPRPHKFLGNIYLRYPKNYAWAEKEFNQALELGMVDVDIYDGLGEVYRNQYRLEEGVKRLKEGVKRIGGENCHLRHFLIQDATHAKMFDVAREALEEAVELCPYNNEVAVDAERFAQMTGTKPLLEPLTTGAYSLGKAQEEMHNPMTIYNYREIVRLIELSGAIPVVMQYPTLQNKRLVEILKNFPKARLVSNVTNFNRALSMASSQEYFSDYFGGTFGHFTAKGARLVAEAAADAINAGSK